MAKTKILLQHCEGEVTLRGEVLEQVTTFKYLGIVLQGSVTWRRRCNLYLKDRIAVATGGLQRIRSHSCTMGLTSHAIRCLLVEAFCISHLLFGSVVFSHT